MTIYKLKRHLIDVNDADNKLLKGPWNEGFIRGLCYAKFIDEKTGDHLLDWIKSEPIIPTHDGYGTFER